MFANRRYPHFKPHRNITITQEFQLYLKRLIMMPIHRVHRLFTTARITQGGFPYHLVLLQLEHDAAFQNHSPFQSMREFLEITVENFANHAPRHHQLVFKAHPLEDGRAAIQKTLKTLAQKFAIEDRIHYVRGGKLARLLDEARSAITVNSTAGQQVLWRGIPLKTFGDALYAKPEFVSDLSQVDAVHTLTSLTGFEALIRGLAVTTYGLPFYAGWGLTTDRLRAPDRRKTSIDLATLVHRALIDYPRYFDPLTKTAAPIEVILDRLAQDQIPSAGPFNRGLSASGPLCIGPSILAITTTVAFANTHCVLNQSPNLAARREHSALRPRHDAAKYAEHRHQLHASRTKQTAAHCAGYQCPKPRLLGALRPRSRRPHQIQ